MPTPSTSSVQHDSDLETAKRNFVKKRIQFDQEIRPDRNHKDWVRLTAPTAGVVLLFKPDGTLFKQGTCAGGNSQ
jgi:hypothetical protein